MTREEAIQWLKAERIVRELFSESEITEAITEALDMAIEALENAK